MRLFQLRQQPPAIQLLVFLCLYFVGTVLFMGASQAMAQLLHIDLKTISSAKEPLNDQATRGLLWLNVLSQVCTFLLPALLFIYLVPDRPAHFLSFKPVKFAGISGVMITALGMLALILGLSAFLQSFSLGTGADAMQEQRKAVEAALLRMDRTSDILIRVLCIALIPAFCEEIFFRGIAQRFFNTFLKKPIWSILATGAFFALFHASVYNFLPIMLAGCVLGLLYHYTGNIWYSILLHFLNNALQVLQAFWVSRNPELEQATFPVYITIGLFLTGIVIVTISLKYIFTRETAFPAQWAIPYANPYQNQSAS